MDRAPACPEVGKRAGREHEKLTQACNGVLISEAA